MSDELLQGVATLDAPYSIEEDGIAFRGQGVVLTFNFLSSRSAVAICEAMNIAYRNGYSAGATMMLNKEKQQ